MKRICGISKGRRSIFMAAMLLVALLSVLFPLLLSACGAEPCVPVADKSWKIILKNEAEMIIEAPLCFAYSDWGGPLKVECFHEYTLTKSGAFCSSNDRFFDGEIAGLILLEGE